MLVFIDFPFHRGVTKVLYDAIVDRFSRMEMVVGCEMVPGSGVPARCALLGTSVICAGTSGRAKLGSCPGSVDTQLGGRPESRF